MINTKLQSIIDTKSAIGNAIVNKGGTITSETPFFNYAAEIDGISTGSVLTGNATANQVFNGQTFYSNDANTQLTGTYVAPQIDGTDETKMFRVVSTEFANISGSEGDQTSIGINNGFLFTSVQPFGIWKYHESNLVYINKSVNGSFNGVTLNNGFVYAFNNRVTKFNQSDLANQGVTDLYGGTVNSIAVNNGVIYAVGLNGTNSVTGVNSVIRRYNETSLSTIAGNSPIYNAAMGAIAINNGFIYAGGSPLVGTNRGISKYHESNLVRISNSVNSGVVRDIVTNNSFVYVAGGPNIWKFNESNLALIGSVAYGNGAQINSISVNSGYIYAVAASGSGGAIGRKLKKYHESNLVFVAENDEEANDLIGLAYNNGKLYYCVGSYVRKVLTNAPFTNSLNGQAWYLISKED